MPSRVDKQRAAPLGGVVSGDIDMPGSRDVWTLSADAGESVELVADDACEEFDLRWAVEKAESATVSGTASMCNDIGVAMIPATGNYQIVVYAYGQETGTYTFRINRS